MSIKYITVVNNFNTLNKALLQSYGVNNNNIIIIDNTLENMSISYRYNNTIKEILKDQDLQWLAFCHQDFYIGEDLLPILLVTDKNYIYGPIGKSSKGSTLGKITQTDGKPLGQICDKCVVETLDAMCMIVHKDIIEKYNLLFDESFKFHFYVEDFSLQARSKGVLTKILQIDCQHRSRFTHGVKDSEFHNSRNALIKKWKSVWTTTGFHH